MAELFREKHNEDTIIATWQISETLEELQPMISLKPGEKTLYDTFVAEDRKKQWLAYRILIRSILSPGDFPIEYDTTGKPYLAGCDQHISVTHSYDMAGVIISRNARVGIDIEKVKPRIERVVERFLSPQEMKVFATPGDHYAMTLAWCAKEALYKLYGLRNLDFRENIRLEGLPQSSPGEFTGEIRVGERQTAYRLFHRNIDGYILVYVLDNPS